MQYSLDFKPRFIVGRRSSERIDFCFYEYEKHRDIKCYALDKDKEVVEIEDENVTKALNKFYSGDDQALIYTVRYEIDPVLGELWICRAKDPKGFLFFVGYSVFSASHAIDDLENAKKLILQRYWKPNEIEEETVKVAE